MKTLRLTTGKPVTRRSMVPSSVFAMKKRKQKPHLPTFKNNKMKDVVKQLRGGRGFTNKWNGCRSRYPLALTNERQNIEIISIILQYGASVNTSVYSSEWTPLYRAVALKNLDIIRMILRYNMNWNATNRNGETVLHLILKDQYFAKGNMFIRERKIIAILKIFLNLGMNINVKTNAGRSPLYLAVKNQMKNVTEFLIKRGADLNVCDYNGNTLAHLLVKDQYESLNYYPRQHEQKVAKFSNWLLSKGVNVDRRNKRGELPIQMALKHKLLKMFEVLLKYTKNINFIDDNNETLLHNLVKLNSEFEVEKLIKLLLNKAASVDIKESNGNTPLHIAAEKKMIKCVLLLSNKFTDVNACNNNLETVLHVLSRISITREDDIVSDIIGVTRTLIKRGIDVNKTDKNQMTAIQLAVLHNNKVMLELLKNYGADCHVKTVYGESLLHLVIKSSDKQNEDEIINKLKMLFDIGINVNNTMNNGETPMFLAVKNRMRKVIDLLISEKADLNICNRDGDSVAHCLINEEFKSIGSTYDNGFFGNDEISYKIRESLDFINWLLSKGLNVDQKNNCGETPLQLAVKYNLLRVIPILLKYANEIDFINERKLTILHMILQLSSDESEIESKIESYGVIFDTKNVVENLLKKGVSIDIMDNYKNTALHIAAQQTQPEFVSILLNYTKNVNARNDLGWTPLHNACQVGNIEIVKTLINHGADVNITEDISGLTPLLVAVYNDNDLVIEILAEAGADLNAKDNTGQTALHTTDSLKSSMSTLLRLGADVDAKDDWGQVPIYYAMTRQDAAAIGQLLDFGAIVSERTLSNFILKELLASDSVMGHHAKLMAAQLSIPKIYTTLTFHRYMMFYKECLKEVDKMRVCEIDEHTTLYDFLHMNPKRRRDYESNEKFRDIMRLSSLIKQFPYYCDIIHAKCQEARDKRLLVKSAKYAWWEITKIYLPDICIENVLEYVDKATLKSLCESTKKRKRSDSYSSDTKSVKRQRWM